MATGESKKSAKPSGQKPTNTTLGSVAAVNHSEPTITLYGREAAAFKGLFGYESSLGRIASPNRPSLHFAIVIDDAYSGIIAIDGQPTTNTSSGVKNMKLITTNFYRNKLPDMIKIKIPLEPPQGMSRQVFAQELIKRAHAFVSYSVDYSVPKNVGGSTMAKGEYNSNSYAAGLLESVMGKVPQISTPGYQVPGWENPIPYMYYKGEANR